MWEAERELATYDLQTTVLSAKDKRTLLFERDFGYYVTKYTIEKSAIKEYAYNMYLKKAIYKNVGPIRMVDIDFPFDSKGRPKPIVFVGENGCGKSTLLSNIVDAFYEIASKAYNNARYHEEGTEYQFFKAISPVQISNGQKYMYTYIQTDSSDTEYYICKSGQLSVSEFKNQTGLNDTQEWKTIGNEKITNINKERAEKIWNSEVICYFGPDRYERPVWLGDKYYKAQDIPSIAVNGRWAGKLDRPIYAHNTTDENLSWLLDLIADSRGDLEVNGQELSIAHVDINALLAVRRARTNIEKILSTIPGEEIYFALNFRNDGLSRFKIMRKSDETVICPTLDSLSTGQLALFNLFANIVRYADTNDINKSINLNEIEGIIVIDEVELHLHTMLQKTVLPELLQLFPKIQFVMTTHAPLFLLGMEEVFGENGFEIYELPNATKISPQKFGEFRVGYDYIRNTETYRKDIELAINKQRRSEKTLVVTEGPTDWKHIKAAYISLKASLSPSNPLYNLDIEFCEYETKTTEGYSDSVMQMGKDTLCSICKHYSLIPQARKIIFIADRDDKKTVESMSDPGEDYKRWGNNVYSIVIPVPVHRRETPNICIEHYYKDEEIKTEWVEPSSEIARRLFIGNEFDQRGVASDIDRLCEKKNKCGRDSIAIIDGSDKSRVTSIKEDNGINYALSKARFADLILNKTSPFDRFEFDSFVRLFEIIKEIVNEK